MSARLLRLVCTAAVTAGALVPAPALAAPQYDDTGSPVSATEAAGPGTGSPGPEEDSEPSAPDGRSVATLLTDLQKLYRQAEQATEAYNTAEERFKEKRAEAVRLARRLAAARHSLHDSRGAAGRLARQQYQNSTGISPYVRLLLARDPQHALDQAHVIGQVARQRAETVDRLTGNELRTEALARAARKALADRFALAVRQRDERDAVRERLSEVEELLASLSEDELTRMAGLERAGVTRAQRSLVASGALGSPDARRTPTGEGGRAVRYAVRQLGKPYEWGAEGPRSYDCSGLTSTAWGKAGRPIPRTSQEQWARLPRVPLDELRPGDLVIYFPEATHVALYLGEGLVVQAPRPGARIKVSPIAANPVLGAVRPDAGGEPLRHYTPPVLPPDAADGSDDGYAYESVPAAEGTAASSEETGAAASAAEER
ncbi:C40 family peptidase [Streptomyces sp. NPDC059785]|uniref:C40 family peptidase n=1 Tax=Streptomyces sp. NPDC059785 TaxID=3346945 RepID=UPI0036685E97